MGHAKTTLSNSTIQIFYHEELQNIRKNILIIVKIQRALSSNKLREPAEFPNLHNVWHS